MTIAGSVFVLVGSVFCLIAAIGILRFPDALTRMHAVSKAGILGAGLVVVGAALASGDLAALVWAILGVAVLLVSGPVAAHLLARASLRSGNSRPAQLSIDEYARDR